MSGENRDATLDVHQLFDSLVRELQAAGYVLSLGGESFADPYVQILNRPERRSLAAPTPSSRTTIRLHRSDAYLRYLENSYPRIFEGLAAAVRADRPFLVVESWLPYVDLGQRLLAFAREHQLNLRCVDYARRESRLNGVRVWFDQARHQWRAVEGPVDEVLRDPRRSRRSWAAAWNPRWALGRAAGRMNLAARRVGTLILP